MSAYDPKRAFACHLPALYVWVSLDVGRDLLHKQLTIMGSWTISKIDQAECVNFVADRKIAVDYLFTHRWQLVCDGLTVP